MKFWEAWIQTVPGCKVEGGMSLDSRLAWGW